MILVAAQFVLLTAAAVLLGVEARTGRMEPATGEEALIRAAIFLTATVAGAALLIALAESEWLFALALAPLTLLSLLRFAMLARRWWTGWRLTLYTSLLIGLGILLSVPAMPYPLDREGVVRSLKGLDGEAVPPDSINPEAQRPVRA